MVKDFSAWKIYDGFYEGSGRSEKIWLTNPQTGQIGLFKYKKDVGTKDYVSEKLAADLGMLLNLPCAKIDIGKYKENDGSMSYLINEENEDLIEGIWLINQIYPNYSAEEMYDSSLCEYYSINMLEKSIEKYGLIKELLQTLIFDYLIGNSDRHQNNWAILNKGEGYYEFSPLYDNSSSLCCYILEQDVNKYLTNDLNRFNSLVRTKSKSIVRIDGKSKKRPTHEEVLKYINDKYQYKISSFVKEIKLKITSDSIDTLLLNYNEPLLSENRKRLIKLFLLEKVKNMCLIIEGEEA